MTITIKVYILSTYMNYKNIIITLLIISFINVPNLSSAIRIQKAQYAQSGNIENNTIQKQAKNAAEKDAIQDTNKIVWFGTGLGCCVTTSTCALAGCVIGGWIHPPPIVGDDVDDIFVYDTTQIRNRSCFYQNGFIEEGCLIGTLLGGLIPLIGVDNYKINPSPKKLIGKSPEYIETYTKTYKKKKRSIRRNMAITGFSTGCLSVGILAYLLDSTSNP